MELLDSRRLTGLNLLWDRPSAVLDVLLAADEAQALITAWQCQLHRMLEAVGWADAPTRIFYHESRQAGDVSLAFAAPGDALYAATEVNEWAWEAACAVFAGDAEPELQAATARLQERIAEESKPVLMALQTAARERELPCLVDDKWISIGLGAGSRCWPATEVERPGAICWDDLFRIPVALVTGTNGKTTSVRLAAAVARAAGHVTGLSSTNWISVNDEIIDHGDYSGPGGARNILRDQRVDVAILETARGGILRRGLALEQVDAVLITNIAEDHLGEFGLPDLASLARLKWVASRAVRDSGQLVLNADDPLLVHLSQDSTAAITWFSLDPDNPVLLAHRRCGGRACWLEQGQVMLQTGDITSSLIAVSDIPLTLNGAAIHNIANVLGVAGLCLALNMPMSAMTEAFRSMQDQANPGRGNLFEINGAKIIVDFAHNPHGMHAIFEMTQRIPAQRRLLLIGQAGDRSDQAIRQLAREAAAVNAERIIIKELARYTRGRAGGEVVALLRDEFARCGVAEQVLGYQEEEMDAVREALQWAQKGDLVLLLVHEDPDAVIGYLEGIQTVGNYDH